VPEALSDQALLQRWLMHKRGRRVRILVPERGTKFGLLQLARENAEASLADHVRTRAVEYREARDVQGLFGLPKAPERVEGFDISNTMGTHSVASMVVWEDGVMKKADYRRFRVRTVEGANDFASMHEVVTRRYGGTLASSRKKALPLPDLILIDGGPGQLGAAVDALRELGLGHLAVIGLAKAKGDKAERVYIPGRRTPHILSPTSHATRLLQRIRDEAHRFAITYHRKLRGQAFIVPAPAARRARTPRPAIGTGDKTGNYV